MSSMHSYDDICHTHSLTRLLYKRYLKELNCDYNDYVELQVTAIHLLRFYYTASALCHLWMNIVSAAGPIPGAIAKDYKVPPAFRSC